MFRRTPLGYEMKTEKILVFFGDKNATLAQLTETYPKLQFRQLKQTHSDMLIDSKPNSENIEGDAHWTAEKNVALIIRTADCMPIMAYDAKTDRILAIHAGWRGVQNQITLKSLTRLKMQSGILFIGPHITQKSFEVQGDVKDALMKSAFDLQEKDVALPQDDKFLVDLEKIVRSQILKSTENVNVDTVAIDTKTNLELHSYRRDKENSGRNLSFIAKI